MHTYHIVFSLNNDPTHYWYDIPAADQKDAIRAWNEIRRVIPGKTTRLYVARHNPKDLHWNDGLTEYQI